MKPTVVSIHIAPGRRLPTRSVPRVEAEAGVGLVGDRYHGSAHRHVTLQSIEALEAAAADLGRPVEPGLTRRNITVSGGPVPTRPGSRVTIGDVELEVVRVAAPCRLLDDELGEGAARALHDRAGTVLRLLTSGTISVGDEVDVRGP
ncbi:molybdenum cofactor sulfurase [Intrasporangium oryzae NRRL B-24470]|uniref:Molybdenum cofactor sulfurase n=1 Tax=Intrasporangium oryzae NRRL B-24470 TaxID=1386089 RepID=W9G646_9MICO|nr:MOSC domain-containing protein [Intrasporangium oryzae]EWT00787.1 molybdenum cofactor sulfurase [Intrasporangium oryzae NRRL B-24470]